MSAGYRDDVEARARAILISSLHQPRIIALVEATARRVQELEDAALDLRLVLDLDDATGGWLDRLGRIVGEAREGLDDQTYRRFVRARLAINRSEGGVEELLSIGRALSGGVALYHPAHPAGYQLTLVTPTPSPASLDARLRQRIEDATASGVGVALIIGAPNADAIFRLDVSTMPDAGDAGDGMPRAV